jgi:hypothetical protein
MEHTRDAPTWGKTLCEYLKHSGETITQLTALAAEWTTVAQPTIQSWQRTLTQGGKHRNTQNLP